MTTDSRESARPRWYESDTEPDVTVSVLEAMRTIRAAESAMRRRSQASMGMGENDIVAMRYLLRANDQDKTVGPKELAQHLAITSASVTVLLDRLERNGHIRREPSPFDRRAIIIAPTVPTDKMQRATLGEVHPELVAVVKRLSPDDADAVLAFLNDLREAIDQIDAQPAFDQADDPR